MVRHKPIPKTNVKIGDKVYRCDTHGIVELPEIYNQFNPIEEKPKKKKVVKKKEEDTTE